jgi:hypothetical protein
MHAGEFQIADRCNKNQLPIDRSTGNNIRADRMQMGSQLPSMVVARVMTKLTEISCDLK